MWTHRAKSFKDSIFASKARERQYIFTRTFIHIGYGAARKKMVTLPWFMTEPYGETHWNLRRLFASSSPFSPCKFPHFCRRAGRTFTKAHGIPRSVQRNVHVVFYDVLVEVFGLSDEWFNQFNMVGSSGIQGLNTEKGRIAWIAAYPETFQLAWGNSRDW